MFTFESAYDNFRTEIFGPLTQEDLDKARLEGLRIVDGVFEHEKIPEKSNFENITFRNCIFERYNVFKANFECCDFHDCKFNNCHIARSRFDSCNFSNTIFSKGTLVACHLHSCHFLNGSRLEGVEFATSAFSLCCTPANLIVGGQRSDGYQFFLVKEQFDIFVKAGCRTKTPWHAVEHWSQWRNNDLNRETLVILDAMFDLARMRGWDVLDVDAYQRNLRDSGRGDRISVVREARS